MPNRTVLVGAQVFTTSAAGVLGDAFVAIQGNRIESVGPIGELRPSPEDAVMDLGGGSVLPGLIDSHTHLISATAVSVTEDLVARGTISGTLAARAALRSGITAVRDLGCKHAGIYVLKRAVESGQVPGPRIYTAGRNISGTGVVEAWRNFSYDGPDAFRRAVRKEWQAGADWAKLIVSDGQWEGAGHWRDVPLVSREEAEAAVSEAHAKSLRVSCHVDGRNGARLAVACHVDSIEHGVDLDPDLIAQMAEAEITFVPTAWCYAHEVFKAWRGDEAYLQPLHRRTFERALAAGIKIVVGTDADYSKASPIDALLSEMSTLVAWGLTRVQALEAVTLRGAELLGVQNELGTIEPGKVADLMVVDGNPLLEFEALRRVVLVLQDGAVVFDRTAQKPDTVARPLVPVEPCPVAPGGKLAADTSRRGADLGEG